MNAETCTHSAEHPHCSTPGVACPWMVCDRCDHGRLVGDTALHVTCIDGGEHEGKVEYREPLSGTGRSFPRCEGHWEIRLDMQTAIDRRYPQTEVPPADFDPTYAGETW